MGITIDGSKIAKLYVAAASYLKFRKMVESCDVVHMHLGGIPSFERKFFFAKCAEAAGKKVILHCHAGSFDWMFEAQANLSQKKRMIEFISIASRVVVLSEEWYDYFAANVCDPSKLVVLHNAVKVPEKNSTPSASCAHQDILFLGRLDARKSPDVLLRASSRIADKHPHMRLRFGGDGFPERYEVLSHELGIADRCEFLGWVTGEDKERLFADASVYCLPSKNEGMPMSALEAMAHGVATIATPVGGVPQVIEDGVDGLLCPIDDEERLAELLDALLSDDELRSRIAAAGRKKIECDFNVDNSVHQLMNLYEELAN